MSGVDDYRQLGTDGPYLPHQVEAEWPSAGAKLRMKIRKWRLFPQVTADSIQFAAPEECSD